MPDKTIKKILVLRTEHIGDFTLTIPCLRTLKDFFPESRITVVIGPWNKSLAQATPYVDDIIIFDNPLSKRHLKIKDIVSTFVLRLKRIFDVLKEIRKVEYDLFIVFSNRRFNKVFIPFIRAKKKLFDFKFDPNKNDKERYKGLLGKIGIREIFPTATLRYIKEDYGIANKILSKGKSKKKIIIHAITPLPEKNWKIENWSKLLNDLLGKDKNLFFIFIGAPDQRAEISEIIMGITNKKNTYNAAGEASHIQSALLIKNSDLFIGCDSGPKQFAEQLTNTPTISLFGPTNEKMWGLTRKIDKVIKADKMDDISVEMVAKEAEGMLGLD